MRILVTGAAGHIGRKLCVFLAERGHALVEMDVAGGEGIVEADLSQWQDDWLACFANVDCVVHLAGCARPDAGWDEVQRLNLDTTLHVLEAAARHRVPRVVFASSNWVLSGHRWDDAVLDEALVPHPTNPYAMSKLAGERMGLFYSRARGISFIALRIGYAQHGPAPRPGPHMAWGPWGQLMWLSERDLCNGFECAINASAEHRFAVVNLVSDNAGMRWDLAGAARVTGYRPVDASVPEYTEAVVESDQHARDMRAEIERLEHLLLTHRW